MLATALIGASRERFTVVRHCSVDSRNNACNREQCRRFAGTVTAEDRHYLPRLYMERELVDDRNWAIPRREPFDGETPNHSGPPALITSIFSASGDASEP